MARKNKTKKEKNTNYILSREERIQEIQQFNLISDVFLSVALEDVPACEHVLRILTGIKDWKLKKVKTQYSISKINSRSVRLDVLAEDNSGRLYMMEVQRKKEKSPQRRERYYGALVDGEFLRKGHDYTELSERYVFYLSEKDIWKQKKP